MVQTLPKKKNVTPINVAGEQQRLERQIALTTRRAALVEERQVAATAVASIDAKLELVDADIASALAPATNGTNGTVSSDGRGTRTRKSAAKKAPAKKAAAKKAPAKKAAAKKAPAKKAAAKKAPAKEAARGPRTGGTGMAIIALLEKRPSKTLSPAEIREATGLNPAVVAKTLQRLTARGSVVRAGTGAYQAATA